MQRTSGIMALAVLTGLLLASAPVSACQWGVGGQLLPDERFPSVVPPSVSFQLLVMPDSAAPTQVSLADAAGTLVDLDTSERIASPYPLEYWVARPLAPLAVGDYVLTITPNAGRGSGIFDVTVSDSAEPATLPDVDVDLDSEKTNSPASCADSQLWRATLNVEAAGPLPPIAFILSDFEMPDGTTLSYASSPNALTSRSFQIEEPFDDGPDCVTSTAVTSTGERLELGRVCARGGCSTTGQASPSAVPLLVVAFLFGRRRRALVRDVL